jgi:ribosomal protein L21
LIADEDVIVGDPWIKGAKIEAKVIAISKVSWLYLNTNRNNDTGLKGHRQQFTRLQVIRS